MENSEGKFNDWFNEDKNKHLRMPMFSDFPKDMTSDVFSKILREIKIAFFDGFERGRKSK